MHRMPSRSALAACSVGSLLSCHPGAAPQRQPSWEREFHLTGPALIARVKPQNAEGTLGAEELRFLEEFNHVADSVEPAGYFVAVSFRDTIVVIPPSDSFRLAPWRLGYQGLGAYGFTAGREALWLPGFRYSMDMLMRLRNQQLTPRPLRELRIRPTSLVFQALSVGAEHTCARTAGERVFCWGANASRHLGNAAITDTTRPAAVGGGVRFVAITAGNGYTCGRTATGAAYCWGANSLGQLGDGTNLNRADPVAVVGGRHFVEVTAGGDHTCGRTATGTAFCWGWNSDGQLGTGGRLAAGDRMATRPAAVAGGLRFVQVAAGWGAHTCGRTATGAAYCWGANTQGELGDGTKTPKWAPVAVAGGLRFVDLSALGYVHTCGRTRDGRAFCWGGNQQGQLGDSTPPDQTTPVAVAGGLRFVELSAGNYHTCGRTVEGRAFCWGGSNNGERGDGAFASAAVRSPVAVVGGLRFVELRAGGGHTCGRTRDGAAFCWGWNGHGELGDGGTTASLAPVQVIPRP
jgi:alpha-tubulin suppressor-like RCC1 family protein